MNNQEAEDTAFQMQDNMTAVRRKSWPRGKRLEFYYTSMKAQSGRKLSNIKLALLNDDGDIKFGQPLIDPEERKEPDWEPVKVDVREEIKTLQEKAYNSLPEGDRVRLNSLMQLLGHNFRTQI